MNHSSPVAFITCLWQSDYSVLLRRWIEFIPLIELLGFIDSWISSSLISCPPLFFQIIFLSFSLLFLGLSGWSAWRCIKVMFMMIFFFFSIQTWSFQLLYLQVYWFFLLIAQTHCWNSSQVFISLVFFSSKIFAWLLFIISNSIVILISCI